MALPQDAAYCYESHGAGCSAAFLRGSTNCQQPPWRGGRAERRELELLRRHFGCRARAVCLVRVDRHLASGRRIELDKLGRGVRNDLCRLAAEVASGFALGFAPDAVIVSGRG